MDKDNSIMQRALEQQSLTMIRPKESSNIFLGSTKDVIQINSKADKIYNELLERVMDSINQDRAIMLSKEPINVAKHKAKEIGKRGGKSETNTPEVVTGRPSNIVATYSDMELDKKQLAESNDPRDKLKVRVMEKIEQQFKSRIEAAEKEGKPLDAQEIKAKQNATWSIIKDEIDGVKKPRKEIEQATTHVESTTPDSTYVKGKTPWKKVNTVRVNKTIDTVMDPNFSYKPIEIDTKGNFKTAGQYNIKRSSTSAKPISGGATELSKFTDFTKNKKDFIAYDIETIGNALDSNRFSVVEIAAQKYNHEGQKTGSFVRLIEMLPEERKEMAKVISILKKDKYAFNGLSDWQQRSVIDLMRYSTENHSAAELKDNLVHNPYVGEIYDSNENVRKDVLFDDMDTAIKHMESGLENLTYNEQKENIVVKAEDAMRDFTEYGQENKNALFVGHNSYNFDDKKLLEWHSGPASDNLKNNVTLPESRLDFVRLINATYSNPQKLLDGIWTEKGEINTGYKRGFTTLYEFQRALGLDIEAKHSALADVGDDGLGGVFKEVKETFNKEIHTSVQKDSSIKTGEVLYADKGYMNYTRAELGQTPGLGGEINLKDIDTSKVDLSFMVEHDVKTGDTNIVTSDFNPAVLNSKSFYEVQGIQEMEDGNKALVLHDYEQARTAFIVRSGENAIQELEDFVQLRLLPWTEQSEGKKQQIIRDRQQDLSRRRYDKMFSPARKDMSRIGGYQSASRYFEAAKLYKRRIEGKEANIRHRAKENVMKKYEGKKVKQKKLTELIKVEENRLRSQRLSAEEFETQMKQHFMTMWDPEQSEWVFNKKEYQDFFPMAKRLNAEAAIYQPIIDEIEKTYRGELIEAQAELDVVASDDRKGFIKAKNKHTEITRKMDDAFIAYAVALKNEVDMSDKKEVAPKADNKLKQFRVEDKGKERIIDAFDFDTAKRTLSSYIYNGLSHIENKDTRRQISREKLIDVVAQIESSGIATPHTEKLLRGAIRDNDVTHNAMIAVAQVLSETPDARKNKTHDIKVMNKEGNEEIKKVPVGIYYERNHEIDTLKPYTPVVKNEMGEEYLKLMAKSHVDYAATHREFTQTGSSEAGKKFKFNPQMETLLDELDNKQHLNGLKPNNRLAVETVLESILKDNPERTVAFSLDSKTNNLVFSVGTKLDNTFMLKEIQAGRLPTTALNISLPLIGKSGTQRIGDRVLNARSYYDYEVLNKTEGRIKEASSVERIAGDYAANMKRLLSQLDYSDVEHAQSTASYLLNESSQSLAGIQRGQVSFNDTNYFSNNMSDFIKQSHVDIQSALIKQMYHTGLGGATLKATDFNNPNDIIREGNVVGNVTFDDVKFDSQYKVLLASEKFIEENGLDLYTSGVKDDGSAGKKLSKVDVRLLGAFRDFISQTRSNSIQAANGVILNEETTNAFDDLRNQGGAYVTTKQHVTTDLQREFLEGWENVEADNGEKINAGKSLSFDMKVMYMNDTDVFNRMQWMTEQEEGLRILKKENMVLLNEDGSLMRDKDGKAMLDPTAAARVYEQQIIINENVMGSLKGNRSKTFRDVERIPKSMQAEMDKVGFIDLKPGDLIGFNKDGSHVFWEANERVGRMTTQNGQVVVDWTEDLHKLQIGGEKGTAHTVSQDFLHYFTGDKEIAAIMNPNVFKHLDLGMLFESKAGLFGKRARELANGSPKDKKTLAALNEEVKKVGLEWDPTTNQYIERARKYFRDQNMNVSDFHAILNDNRFNLHGGHVALEVDPAVASKVKELEAQKAELQKPLPKGLPLSNDAYAHKQQERAAEIQKIDKKIAKLKPTKNFEVGVLNGIASAVYDHSRTIDGTGKEVIDMIPITRTVVDKDGNETEVKELKKIYAESKGNRGVSWGHRELAALREKGLNATADKMLQQMIKQGSSDELYDEDGKRVNSVALNHGDRTISRLQESHNLLEALNQMTNLNQEAETIKMFDGKIKPLPAYKGSFENMKETIFDKQYIQSLLDDGGNPHGYWLQLPKTELSTGEELKVGVNVHGAKAKNAELTQTDKIFVPYTNLEGVNGDVHLREMQRNIADIYKKAEAVENAGDGKLRVEAARQLQTAVDNYTTGLVKDLTSSKGMFGSSVGRVKMGFSTAGGSVSSASALFKLIDPLTSAKSLDGEYTFISENMAKKMGVFDQLDGGKEMFVMNNRYPTFHHDAMQVTKLKIGKNVKDNEVHTTAFFSDLLRADSDGDMNNITVDTDESVQSEWKKHYEAEKTRYDREVKELIEQRGIVSSDPVKYGKEAVNKAPKEGYTPETVDEGKPATASRVFNIDELATQIMEDAEKNGNKFEPGKIMDRNTAEEIAAKIGKNTIGMASNLNLQMQQVAKEYLAHDPESKEAMMRLGQTLEQKLISSKHGASIGDGKNPALEFINAIKGSGHSKAARNTAQYYAKEFFSELNIEDDLAKTIEGLQVAYNRSTKGILNEGFKAGTSGGVNALEGLSKVHDIIRGHMDPADVTTANSFLNMIRHMEDEMGYYEGERPKEYRLQEEMTPKPEEKVDMPESKLTQGTREVKKFKERAGEKMKRFGEGTKDRAKGFVEGMKKRPILAGGLIAGGVALAGAGLYNVTNKDNPLEDNQRSQNSPAHSMKPSKSALPEIDNHADVPQAVNVNISANGNHSINQSQVGGLVSHSLNNSGVSSSGANMHITQRDNSQNLNPIWYRDKVQENI